MYCQSCIKNGGCIQDGIHFVLNFAPNIYYLSIFNFLFTLHKNIRLFSHSLSFLHKRDEGSLSVLHKTDEGSSKSKELGNLVYHSISQNI
jgi:hypothetical protein